MNLEMQYGDCPHRHSSGGIEVGNREDRGTEKPPRDASWDDWFEEIFESLKRDMGVHWMAAGEEPMKQTKKLWVKA